MSKKGGGCLLLVIGAILFTICIVMVLKAADETGHIDLSDVNPLALLALIGGMVCFISGIMLQPAAPPSETEAVSRPPKQPRVKPQVVKAKLLSVDGVNATTRSGTVSGALVGGILAGSLGAIVGGMANTTDHTYNVDTKYTFLVLYDNGTQQLETLSARGDKKRLELLVSKIDINEN